MFTQSFLLELIASIGYSATLDFVFESHERLKSAGYFDICTALFDAWQSSASYARTEGFVRTSLIN